MFTNESHTPDSTPRKRTRDIIHQEDTLIDVKLSDFGNPVIDMDLDPSFSILIEDLKPQELKMFYSSKLF